MLNVHALTMLICTSKSFSFLSLAKNMEDPKVKEEETVDEIQLIIPREYLT